MRNLKHKLNQRNPPTEHEEQSDFVGWFELQFPTVRLYAVPNGIRTGFKQAIKAKREGMRSGVPDLHIPAWDLFIEMKRTIGGTVSPEQKDWHYYLTEHCNKTVIVAKGCQDAVNKVMQFLDSKSN